MALIQEAYVNGEGNVTVKRSDGVRIEISGFSSEQQAQEFVDFGDFNEIDNRFSALHGQSLTFVFL